MVAVLVLAVVAAGVIRLLMGVVAHEEAGGFVSATSDYSRHQTYDPTMPVARPVNDDVRGFLLPAVEDPHAVDAPARSDDANSPSSAA